MFVLYMWLCGLDEINVARGERYGHMVGRACAEITIGQESGLSFGHIMGLGA